MVSWRQLRGIVGRALLAGQRLPLHRGNPAGIDPYGAVPDGAKTHSKARDIGILPALGRTDMALSGTSRCAGTRQVGYERDDK
jgi:hypothetical protein